MTEEYQTGIVRGLRKLQDVLGVISGEDNRLPKYKYYQRQGIVCFSANGGTNIAKVVQELQRIGLSTIEVSKR